MVAQVRSLCYTNFMQTVTLKDLGQEDSYHKSLSDSELLETIKSETNSRGHYSHFAAHSAPEEDFLAVVAVLLTAVFLAVAVPLQINFNFWGIWIILGIPLLITGFFSAVSIVSFVLEFFSGHKYYSQYVAEARRRNLIK
jgi:fatty acid desaturase